MTEKKPQKSFEDCIKGLDTVLSSLEKGELSLDRSFELFEQGMKDIRYCQNLLKKTEQRVSVLIEKEGGIDLENFDQKR